MNNSMVITNVRFPQARFLQAKARAGELGISFNEYINRIVMSVTTMYMMEDRTKMSLLQRRKAFFKAIRQLSETKSTVVGYDLSEEDKTIYGI